MRAIAENESGVIAAKAAPMRGIVETELGVIAARAAS